LLSLPRNPPRSSPRPSPCSTAGLRFRIPPARQQPSRRPLRLSRRGRSLRHWMYSLRVRLRFLWLPRTPFRSDLSQTCRDATNDSLRPSCLKLGEHASACDFASRSRGPCSIVTTPSRDVAKPGITGLFDTEIQCPIPSAAASAAPTIPASLCRDATRTLLRSSSIGAQSAAALLIPPPRQFP